MDKIKLRNRIANLPAIAFLPGVSDSTGDNLAIALATYFEDHDDRPKDDPPSEESESWGKWTIERTNDALDRIVAEVVDAEVRRLREMLVRADGALETCRVGAGSPVRRNIADTLAVSDDGFEKWEADLQPGERGRL